MDNKTFVNSLSKRLSLDTKSVSALVEGLSVVLGEKCGAMDTVAIPGFGTFAPVKRDERVETDPGTGRRMLYPPSVELEFRVSALLRRQLAK